MTCHEQLIGVDEPKAWRAALAGVPHGYWHTWEACCSANLASGLPTYLYVAEDTDAGLRAVLPFSERRWKDSTDVFTPTGFSGFAIRGGGAEVHERWLAFAAKRGYVCAYFALHPMLTGAHLHEDVYETNDLYVTDLTVGETALFAHVGRNIRRQVRDWNASGFNYVTDRALLKEFILTNYREFMFSSKANPSAMWTEDGLQIMCSDPAVLIVGAADEQGICAAYTFATTPWGAECHLNISVREGRQFTAALIWWGMCALMATGVPWLNLGGGVSRNDAIAKAKQSYRPAVFPLRSAREIYQIDTYRAHCFAAGNDPSQREGFFPRYHMASTTHGA